MKGNSFARQQKYLRSLLTTAKQEQRHDSVARKEPPNVRGRQILHHMLGEGVPPVCPCLRNRVEDHFHLRGCVVTE